MVQSLERAFAILDEVAQRPAGVTAIAERVRLPKSTVARLLATLEDVDAVERFDGVRWRIGPGVAALTDAVSPERSLISIAAAVPRRPRVRARRGCGARAPRRERDPLRRPGRVRQPGTGAGLDGHAGADARRAVRLRSSRGVAEGCARRVPAGVLVPLTPRTVTDPARLRARLGDVRNAGHAWGLEEFAEGIDSVAAPVRDARGKAIAAIHVHGPSYRFPPEGREAVVAARVQVAAAAVGAQLAGL